MALLRPIYGNQSRKQMLQTAFQKHPEKCTPRLVSAWFEGKGCSADHTGVSHMQGYNRQTCFTHKKCDFLTQMFNYIHECLKQFRHVATKKKHKLNKKGNKMKIKLPKHKEKNIGSSPKTETIIPKRLNANNKSAPTVFPLAPLSNKVALSAGPNNLWTRVGAARGKKLSTWR